MEKRMYFLVLYSLSGIQKGIQAGHSVVEYLNVLSMGTSELDEYLDWARNYKTFILLDGGTSNDGEYGLYGQAACTGTLQEYSKMLSENNIPNAIFKEPDLNNALTSISFLVDERVFNMKDYPTYVNYIHDRISAAQNIQLFKMKSITMDELISRTSDLYAEWLNFIGGEKNAFLKSFLYDDYGRPSFKLASN